MSVQSGRNIGSGISLPNVTRYDLLLAALPILLLSGAAVGVLSSVALHVGVALGAVPSILLLYYGLFHSAPTPATD
jgi:hypothetical protein